ncbi:4'-phosphopantetheinyl transferase family protein [Pseudoalteromonas denitrificans]|uniref:4'-phosphopantetheinyl transferase n=1 Tax=Pseudoalteromonas denitrificans DSM 6059 TaxID=1123010 RepID=A0A1I1RFC6_9GAMM|nr:4'-phosphopantetheinyl transferase superfamily protein [Pseudoalteromonas denitrificans]SFD32827.1 4'-phosphopantetheinyl transferase [Pseudoalteromonas denitrificans DSM 6059]
MHNSIQKLSLEKNEIHLWYVYPNKIKQIDLLNAYHALLTPDETQKQQRYKFEKDRHSALITRAFVRDLLSQYVQIKPESWRFEKGEYDKPEIKDPPLPLRFNLSHTDELIICAVTLQDDIGCDVENMTRDNDVLGIADRFFSKKESEELFSLPLTQQRNRFFDYWTLKESYIKAWGLGLSIPLKDFSFDIGVNENNQVNHNIQLSFAQHRIDHANVWRSWLFYPNDKHRIALSVRAKNNNQNSQYKMRFFNSTPLISYKESTGF